MSQFKADDAVVRGPRSGNTVAQLRADISGVINDIGVDVLVVVEGPNRAEELQLFFYSRPAGWVGAGRVRREMSDGQPIYRKFPCASHHYPVTCDVMT